MYQLSIDVGGTTSKCALFKNGNIAKKFIIKTDVKAVFENIYNTLLINLKAFDISYDEIEWISFSICGPVNMKTNVLEWAGNLNLTNYDLNKELKTIFNKKFFVMNDAKAAAYGEYVLGQKKEPKSVAVITIGTGIGTALILDSELWFGTNAFIGSEGGHGGHMSRKVCTCGVTGCTEAQSSATGIERELNTREIKTYISSVLNYEKDKFTIKDVASLVKSGDAVITEVFTKALTPLGNTIGLLMYWLDLNKIIIGGGVSELGDSLINIIESIVKNSVSEFIYSNTVIETAVLKNDAGVWGAYWWATEHDK